jgi:hypothetical protein
LTLAGAHRRDANRPARPSPSPRDPACAAAPAAAAGRRR